MINACSFSRVLALLTATYKLKNQITRLLRIGTENTMTTRTQKASKNSGNMSVPALALALDCQSSFLET